MNCRLGESLGPSDRPQFFQVLGECLKENADCAGGEDASWQACFEEASLRVPLTQAAFDFCESMGQLFFECGYGMSPVTCARNYIVFTDAALLQLQVCGGKTCDTYSDCINQVVSH